MIDPEIMVYEYVKQHGTVAVRDLFAARGDVSPALVESSLIRMLLHHVVQFTDDGDLELLPAGEWTP